MSPSSVVAQKSFVSCEEMRSSFSGLDRGSMACPKPRRPLLFAHSDSIRPLRCQISRQAELSDSKAGTEILDIILTKGDCGADQGSIASSPPFFCGSPPSRAANPLVHDARFGDEKLHPMPTLPMPMGLSVSPSSASPRRGCAQASFGFKPAAVRIEGFNSLERGGRSCSISAMA